MKNKTYLIAITALFIANNVYSQIKDISFTVSPFVDYTWWDSKAGLEDGVLYGAKVGFGFGEYLELRAVYLKSNDLKTNFENYNFTGFNAELYNPQELVLTRWGGEFKANIYTSGWSPYITLGTGVQNIEINKGADFDQIYTSLGLGIKTKISDNVSLNIEGKNTAFNFDSGKNLLTEDDKIAFGVTDADFKSNLLYNWSVQASLQIYLSGRKQGTLSALDKAYLNKFRGGFKGIQWIIEPGASYVNFDTDSQYRDSYFIGGYAGIDFNKFTGIRAFYFQATENEELSTNFDKLAMYGIEFRARLNDGNGVTPFLIVGGGYLNPENSYLASDDLTIEKGQKFASAGLGLNIPLSKNILISGGMRGMVSSSANIEDLTGPDELQTHIMYNAGLKLTFGAKSKNPDAIYQAQVDEALDQQDKVTQANFNTRLEAQKRKNEDKLAKLKELYNMQLDSLQVELENANKENNIEKAVEVLEQKKQTSKALNEVENVSKKSEAIPAYQNISAVKMAEKEIEVQKAESKNGSKELIKMSPQELEMLIDKILEKTDPSIKKEENTNSSEVQQLNNRIDFLEQLIIESNKNASDDKKIEAADANQELNLKIQELALKSDLNSKKIDLNDTTVPPNEKTVVINPPTEKIVVVNPETDNIEVITKGGFIENETPSNLSEKLTYKGFSMYTGVNLGGQTSFNIGTRINYGMQNTKIEFMPEFYYGIANPGTFGLSANFIYPFNALIYSEFMTPYAGIGGGIIRDDGNIKLNHNIIVGTNLNIGKGRFFADFTSRNFSKYNQLAFGYRFNF